MKLIVTFDEYQLKELALWSTLGLRGTCSNEFRLTARFECDAVFPSPFAQITNHGGMQADVLSLGAVWVGIG